MCAFHFGTDGVCACLTLGSAVCLYLPRKEQGRSHLGLEAEVSLRTCVARFTPPFRT
jgi:hypothetical protein